MIIMSSRIQREIRTVQVMIELYCYDNHTKRGLCLDCSRLTDYALERLRSCVFQECKTTCARCPIHCYKPEMRTKIREVMRYSGPRMIFQHPVLAIFHLLDKRRREPIKSVTQGRKFN